MFTPVQPAQALLCQVETLWASGRVHPSFPHAQMGSVRDSRRVPLNFGPLTSRTRLAGTVGPPCAAEYGAAVALQGDRLCLWIILGSMPSFVALRLWVGQRSLQRRRLDGNSTIFQLQNCGYKPHNAQYHQRTCSKNQHTCMEYRGCGPSMIQAAPTLLHSRVGHVDANNADDQVFTKRSQDLNDSRQKQSRKPVQTTLSAM